MLPPRVLEPKPKARNKNWEHHSTLLIQLSLSEPTTWLTINSKSLKWSQNTPWAAEKSITPQLRPSNPTVNSWGLWWWTDQANCRNLLKMGTLQNPIKVFLEWFPLIHDNRKQSVLENESSSFVWSLIKFLEMLPYRGSCFSRWNLVELIISYG